MERVQQRDIGSTAYVVLMNRKSECKGRVEFLSQSLTAPLLFTTRDPKSQGNYARRHCGYQVDSGDITRRLFEP